jgi:hypothetical protein
MLSRRGFFKALGASAVGLIGLFHKSLQKKELTVEDVHRARDTLEKQTRQEKWYIFGANTVYVFDYRDPDKGWQDIYRLRRQPKWHTEQRNEWVVRTVRLTTRTTVGR